MKYGFVRLRNDDGSALFMEVRDFDRYSSYDVFRNHAEALVVYDHVYIGCFPLMFKENEILEYNSEAVVDFELSLKDLAFNNRSVSSVASVCGCTNI